MGHMQNVQNMPTKQK